MTDVESHGDRLDVSVFVGFLIVASVVFGLVFAYVYFVSTPMAIEREVRPAAIAKCARRLADGEIVAKGAPREHCACVGGVMALDWPVGLTATNRLSFGMIGDLDAQAASLFEQAQNECLRR